MDLFDVCPNSRSTPSTPAALTGSLSTRSTNGSAHSIVLVSISALLLQVCIPCHLQHSDSGKTDWSRLPPRLEEFLSNSNKSHSGPRVVFGPNGSILCWSSRTDGRLGQPRTAARWSADQKARMEKLLLNPWTGFPDVAIQFGALGYRGAYFLKFDDNVGTVKSDLRGYYPSLREHLDKIGRRNVQVGKPTLRWLD